LRRSSSLTGIEVHVPSLLAHLSGRAQPPWDSVDPIREELFSVERLEQHARSLAAAQTVARHPVRRRTLASRLADNGANLLVAYRGIAKGVEEGHSVTPAAEWLLDNFHLVEQQTRQIRADLPQGYYRQLPKLADGPFIGYPRVFGIAWAFVAHSDSHVDHETLQRFMHAYQQVQPLTIGELWAVSITLRIVLIENLRRLADQIVSGRRDRRAADVVADRLLGADGLNAEPLMSVLAPLAQAPLPDAFAVQLLHRLRDQDPSIAPALAWLDTRLAAQGSTADAAVHDVHRRQGAANVSVRNIITSLRRIADLDWSDAFERMSLVDDVLTAGSDFHDMDFATRTLYRRAIEELARGSAESELEIAGRAVRAAQQARSACAARSDPQRGDPGYYLLGGGRRALEKTLGFWRSPRTWPARLNRASGIGFYAANVIGLTALLLALPVAALAAMGLDDVGIGLLACLGAIPAIDVAVALVNRAVSIGFGATILPALDLRDGVPASLRTLVAVPTLLTSLAAITEQVERLEIHHLASPDGDLHFALLSDWTDAAAETVDTDAALLDAAKAEIARLNARYGGAPGGARFLLLHRRRVWSESEGCWMGWERKRGKLHELNRLLRAATDTSFVALDGVPPDAPAGIRYVVTLDADTRLPRDTVRRLIGKMAHPLNRPRFDPAGGRVVEGYAVMQPRVTPSLPVGREGSLFQRIFSSLSGIDPYAAAVSDVYQDLFGEGSYAGKGIYDVDAFEAALAGRVPDSSLLSHDLFEGVFARAGLASDVEVVEEYPARYDVGALRHHRWARGDWQLLPWILGRAPIPAVGRWKMFDNLRRTLSAPSAVLALLAGWTLSFDAALLWTGFILTTLVLPALIPVIAAIPPRRSGVTIASHLRALAGDAGLAATLSALLVTFLAHQSWLMGDAILRTLWRLLVSRRHLLEWMPAAQATTRRRLDNAGFYRFMAASPAIGVASLLLALGVGHGGWILAAPLSLLWVAAPAVARRVSLAPRALAKGWVTPADALTLRLTARRTWRFFESFVSAATHMLPPDNFQETPAPVLAQRTSPTNLGLYLLSVAAARDFGWIGTAEAVERLEATLATMQGMERVRGHFYNWYGTEDLRPLEPRYVSSVDSGNLAGHLIALANALGEWRGTMPSPARRRAGIADAIALTHEATAALHDGRQTQTVTWQQLDAALDALAVRCQADGIEALAGDAATLLDMAQALAVERGNGAGHDLVFWANACTAAIASHCRDNTAATLAPRLSVLADRARALALAMEFGFLFDPDRKMLSIGYAVGEAALDASCYDLLASEARLASFIAIAKGDVPAKHWFRLGRAATPVAHGAALISWSGSMFEYLMPSLVMRAPAGSLLEQTNRLVVRRQIDYGRERGVPWGISESAYNVRDLEFTYQYSNFGVPGLGLKRGLGDSLVVAPYATALATMVDPHAAAANLLRLTAVGGRGRYGFYEALDYTKQRLPLGESVAVVRAFMAHHQGMSIVAIADALSGGAMRRRFHAEPMVQATELLLQERMPREVSVARAWAAEVTMSVVDDESARAGTRTITSAHQATPAALLLSNGRYATLLTAAGSGYSAWNGLAVTRWREDVTRDDYGSYVFIRDVMGGAVWSAGFQPCGVEPDGYSVTFTEDAGRIERRDGTLTTMLEVLVSAEDDAEVRRVSINNAGDRARLLDVTSYAELVLAKQDTDVAHPAFAKLFVATEYLPDVGALLATRRRRAPEEPEVWAAHVAVVEGDAVGAAEVETDRARFMGRGHGIRTAIAAIDGRPLSGTVGTVLDPIFALRRRVRIAPGATVRIAFWTMAASTRAAVLDGVDRHRDATAFVRAATLAWTQGQVQLYHLGITAGQAALFQSLAGHIVYAAPLFRPSPDTIRRGGGPQSALWSQGISGDVPIVLLRISDIDTIDVARELVQAHEYWRLKQLAVDLVILNEREPSYVQDLQTALAALVRPNRPGRPAGDDAPAGRVFVLRADMVPAETRALLLAAARVVLVAQRGSLADQFARAFEPAAPARPAVRPGEPVLRAPPLPEIPDLEFFNGLGGFSNGGREYVTVLGPGQSTPAPWLNVVANPGFGFQVATEGSGYTWAASSRENQLTPWSNDPVSDHPGEAIYLRDEDTGVLWGPTALPVRDPAGTYRAIHGAGFSRFQHTGHGIASDLVLFVPVDAPVKIARLSLANQSARPRRIAVTAYVEWVLGPSRGATLPFVTTEIDPASGAMLARNPWNMAFAGRVAFLDLRGAQTDWTGDRREFIGRNGTLADPLALAHGGKLSNSVGAGFDPCGALRTVVDLPAHGGAEIVVLLGQGNDVAAARELVAHWRTADLDAAQADVARQWETVLGAVQVRTPDRSFDIMLNGWLLYQTLACRIWARTAFYQASGAYGFRDQLQDGMALAAARPDLTRAHLLRAAGRQFPEGDVQHWWLPHSGQGVRTRISDDRAWLAYTVGHYVAASGDAAVLDAPLAFLEGKVLAAGENDSFFLPGVSDETATLFEHCARALDHSLAVGGHGLPLIGTGDWNDGMNRVGEHGAGESVWLGWFLHAALTAFAPLADARGEASRAAGWRTAATALAAALERDAWDGDWYRRGYFDDGTPLGSASSDECRIDSIAQSWAVLSGAADPAHAAAAMAAVDRALIRRADGLALLFTPPFDKTTHDPGYIKAYPPGIRENGGQYTHAAAWSVMAYAALGEGDTAAGLFWLLNPINHARSRADVHRYKVEPYVVAADVYAVAPHVGRGGWTWYTGSAGWMQRAGIESILGVRLEGDVLCLDPCIPKGWPGFTVSLRHGAGHIEIQVKNPDGVGRGIAAASFDGVDAPQRPLRLRLADDGAVHRLNVRLG
jgi:cyclic beta-1,2-glucan synthetase